MQVTSELPMPGGFDAHALYAKIEADRKRAKVSEADQATTSAEEPFVLQRYWIGWYAAWVWGDICHGTSSVHFEPWLVTFAQIRYASSK